MYEFVNKIRTITVPAGAMLFTVDIDALYTNIDTKLGLKAVKHIFERDPDSQRPDEALLQLSHEMILFLSPDPRYGHGKEVHPSIRQYLYG